MIIINIEIFNNIYHLKSSLLTIDLLKKCICFRFPYNEKRFLNFRILSFPSIDCERSLSACHNAHVIPDFENFPTNKYFICMTENFNKNNYTIFFFCIFRLLLKVFIQNKQIYVRETWQMKIFISNCQQIFPFVYFAICLMNLNYFSDVILSLYIRYFWWNYSVSFWKMARIITFLFIGIIFSEVILF